MNFKGSLEGIGIEDLKITDKDREKKLFAERLEVLDGKLKCIGEYRELLTDEIYDTTITIEDTDTHQYTIRLSRLLDTYGSYLLSATDIKKNKTRDKHITKTSEEYDKSLTQKATKKHSNFEVAIASTSEANTTKYVNIETVITENDFKNNKYGSTLQEYENARKILVNKMLSMQNRLSEENCSNTEEIKHSLNQLKSLISNLNQDMIITKEAYKGLTTYTPKEVNNPYVSSSHILDIIDYTNSKHISVIIKEVDLFQEFTPNNGISEISFDISNIILNLHKKRILSDYELLLIQLINGSNLSFEEIATRLNRSRKTIYNNFNSIAKKICNHQKKGQVN